ncbi:MAG: CPXCG motif-containing cysteine-rich protein [Pseudomonadota bacterium]
MNEENLQSVPVKCPHCGHNTFLDIDASEGNQDYQEECSACGDLIHVQLQIDEVNQQARVKVDGNDEQFY